MKEFFSCLRRAEREAEIVGIRYDRTTAWKSHTAKVIDDDICILCGSRMLYPENH